MHIIKNYWNKNNFEQLKLKKKFIISFNYNIVSKMLHNIYDIMEKSRIFGTSTPSRDLFKKIVSIPETHNFSGNWHITKFVGQIGL